MCKEGACGACVVSLTTVHPVTGELSTSAITSCLTPVLACHGGFITTVEGIGNREDGYSPVQGVLARCFGTQCGFCSPGMVMTMRSLLEAKKNITMEEVENSFGGNLCRCTGYRPILDAFKTLSSDATNELKQKVADIEDIWKICNNDPVSKSFKVNGMVKTHPISAGNKSCKTPWLIPVNLKELKEIIKNLESDEYTLVAGNTSQGVYKRISHPNIFIDINHIKDLKDYSVTDTHLELGANISLTELMDLFFKLGNEKFHFLKELADHIQLVANVPVRNVGTLAGNLVLKHQHPEFPSDLFVMLETVNAKIELVKDKGKVSISPTEFLERNLEKTIITKVMIPILSEEYTLRTFKIMPRAQNAYACVNAGFLFKLNNSNNIIGKPNIVFGGISSKFVHATQTEEYFVDKNILDFDVLKESLSTLYNEIMPSDEGFPATPAYRKKLSVNLFYKFLISLIPEHIPPSYKSGETKLSRPLSCGRQSYATIKEHWPLTKPNIKTEAIIQCSGEAEYVNDIPEAKGQLFGSFVLVEQAGSCILNIDPTKALEMEGVVAFLSAKDIPGKNLFIVKNKFSFMVDEEELFCSGKVLYAGQPVGLVVACTDALAEEATSKVVVTYKPGEPPILNVKDVLKKNITSRIKHFSTVEPEEDQKNGGTKYELSGEIELSPQYHFTMEPQSCVCVPMEDGINLYSATQWMSGVQEAVSAALGIPENSINMHVRRLGGGFGCKITRSSLTATACALAAYKLNRPVKVVLDIQANMKAVGKRNATYAKYQVGFDENGLIGWLNAWFYEDMGCYNNDPPVMLVEYGFKNCYNSSKFQIDLNSVITDTPSSSWMRGPGTIEGLTVIEDIMEQISFILKKDSLEVRLKNFGDYSPLLRIISSVIEDSNYHQRRDHINIFNKENRWRKRGIAIVPMAFFLDYFFAYNAMISIYADGTVSLTHGGVEMGQGVNTKAIQACAATLGIDESKIKVKPTSVLTSPNAHMSGASITSDGVVYSTIKCCEIINKRLEKIREKMKAATWEEIIAAAIKQEINLNASYVNKVRDNEVKSYLIYAAAVTEVEVDVLTGQYQILRTDILEDAGESLNPAVDVGQIEGGFVMGLGYFLWEHIALDPQTGLTVTNNTATYWIPGAKDIPADFRVSLLKGSSNPHGVARSKATGEPPICLALSASFALRNAVMSARQDSGLEDWLPFGKPFSVERACLVSNTNLEHLTFNLEKQTKNK